MLVAALAIGAPAVLFAGNPDPAPQRDTARGLGGRFVIVPSITGGLLIGDAGDYLDHVKDKALYGFGLAVEYYVQPRYGLGGKFSAVWKDMSQFEIDAVRTFHYAGYGLFRLFPHNRQSPYARVELGRVTAWGPALDRQLDGPYIISLSSVGSSGQTGSSNLGSSTYFRFGIGLFVTGAKTNTRVEVYYENVRSKGHEGPFSYFWLPEVPFNLEAFAIEIGIGIPL